MKKLAQLGIKLLEFLIVAAYADILLDEYVASVPYVLSVGLVWLGYVIIIRG